MLELSKALIYMDPVLENIVTSQFTEYQNAKLIVYYFNISRIDFVRERQAFFERMYYTMRK